MQGEQFNKEVILNFFVAQQLHIQLCFFLCIFLSVHVHESFATLIISCG